MCALSGFTEKEYSGGVQSLLPIASSEEMQTGTGCEIARGPTPEFVVPKGQRGRAKRNIGFELDFWISTLALVGRRSENEARPTR